MTILIDPGTYNLANFGGVAMFRAAADRLREALPGARLRAFTESGASLAKLCPGVESVAHDGAADWVADRALLGPLQDRLPAGVSRAILLARDRLALRAPSVVRGALRARLRLAGRPTAAFDAFFSAIREADAVVFTGGAGLNDEFPTFLKKFCTVVETAAGHGRPVALFGHAIGPLRPGPTRRRLLEALRRLRLIALRERLESPAYLDEAGVEPERVLFTGDDALELAGRHRPAALGSSLGVSVRIAGYTGLGETAVDLLTKVVAEFRARHGVPAVALPIAVHEAARDQEQIGRILGSRAPQELPGDLSQLLWRVGTCRVVVAGAYHAAVFALAQGIPVVALAQSPLYLAKFRGLQAEFGEGCRLVALEDASRLGEELEWLWERADELRPNLIAAAEEQTRHGLAAYARFAEVLA